MNTFAVTRNYLLARQKILMKEASDAAVRAEDGRATANSQREWRDIAMYARAELNLVEQALQELPSE